MLFDFLEDRCICLITGIACLLAYYDFELISLYNFRFQHCKKLFFMGDPNDYYAIYMKLFEIGDALLEDIRVCYNLPVKDYIVTDVWTYPN